VLRGDPAPLETIVAKRSPISATAMLLSATSAAFNVLHLHLTLPLPSLSFAKIFGNRKVDTLGYRVYLFIYLLRCLCDPIRLVVTTEHRLVTDRRTDTRRQLIPAPASYDLS